MRSSAFLSLLFISPVAAQNCVSPPPAKDFNISNFEGIWYEIARIQTAGGAALQDFCVCTELIYSPTPGGVVGDTTTINSCRFLKPDAFYLNATSYLTNMTTPGHWLERYCEPSCPPASYNIIMEGQGMLQPFAPCDTPIPPSHMLNSPYSFFFVLLFCPYLLNTRPSHRRPWRAIPCGA